MILSQKRRNHPKITSAVKILQGLLGPVRGINKTPDSAADNAIEGGRNISLSIDNIPFGIFHDFAFLHYQIFLGLAKPGKDRGIINDKDLIRVFFDNAGKIKEIHVSSLPACRQAGARRIDYKYRLRKKLFNDFVL